VYLPAEEHEHEHSHNRTFAEPIALINVSNLACDESCHNRSRPGTIKDVEEVKDVADDAEGYPDGGREVSADRSEEGILQGRAGAGAASQRRVSTAH
jgi:hypothetical protein